MLLMDAKDEIDKRREFRSKVMDIPNTYKRPLDQALEIASLSIDAQLRLNDMISDLESDPEGSTYSKGLVMDMLCEIRYQYMEDDDIPELKGKEES